MQVRTAPVASPTALGQSEHMTPLVLLLQILGGLYCFVLPGWLVAVQLDDSWSTLVRAAVGLGLGCLVVPTASFGAAWVLGTSVRPWTVFAVATALNLGAGLFLWWRSRGSRPRGSRSGLA